MPDSPTPEQVAAAAAEATKSKEFPGEFTLGDGTIVKATSYEEAFNKVAEMKVNTAQALRDREEQIRQLQAPPPEKQVIDPQDQYSDKKFWETANVNTADAVTMALAAKLGVPADDLPRMFAEMRNVSVQSADQMEIQAFMQRNPDFPGTPEVSSKLMDIMAAENRPFNAENLEYVYLRSVRDGEIEPLAEEAARPWVPPTVSGGSSGVPNQLTAQQMNSMSDEQYDDMMRKLGLLKDGGQSTGTRI